VFLCQTKGMPDTAPGLALTTLLHAFCFTLSSTVFVQTTLSPDEVLCGRSRAPYNGLPVLRRCSRAQYQEAFLKDGAVL
jgi:hypothetical protein